ncbi:hypothetical protein F7725_025119 [Dissostichus mawsoni]|uniref:Uncharacterized protein n=1 Tax=Dissostichus mawsoni TaxID=36200 RepID=A0A7J5XA88_DISMA|nr:hypothetical protein F7725_025119 [Dissostichus mawsoni]
MKGEDCAGCGQACFCKEMIPHEVRRTRPPVVLGGSSSSELTLQPLNTSGPNRPPYPPPLPPSSNPPLHIFISIFNPSSPACQGLDFPSYHPDKHRASVNKIERE